MHQNSVPSARLTGEQLAFETSPAIPDLETLALIAVQRSRMPMVLTDARQADNPIVMANQAFLNLTGYTAGEVIGRNCRFLQGEGTATAAVEELRSAIAVGRDANVEILNFRKDGSEFWNQLYVSPIYDEDGELSYFFASQKDVTAQRRVEALEVVEHRLLREVDHRAMNVLAIVEGVVRLTRAQNVEDYAAAVQGRVQALAKAHTLLAERGWDDVPLALLLEAQISPFGLSHVSFEGPDVRLPGDIVQPLSIVFHELAANAARHGALAEPGGELHVGWRLAPARRFMLSWVETGGPPPCEDRPTGFGTKIIDGVIRRQLRGELRRTWHAEGLTVEIEAPTLPT